MSAHLTPGLEQPREATRARGIDPRGPQFTAAITAVVLIVILLVDRPVALALTAIQAVLFAVGTLGGVQNTPHSFVFRHFVRPRLSPPSELEDPEPPRFAQGVGLVFTLVALGAFIANVTVLADIAIGLALIAALLNAVFRFCLGCEMYLLIKRFAH